VTAIAQTQERRRPERLSASLQDHAFQQLVEARQAKEEIPRWRAAAVAEAVGRSPSAVYRAARRGYLGRKPKGDQPLDEEEQKLFARCGGSIAALAKEMKEQLGDKAGSETTYRRRVRATYTAAEVAFIKRGAKAMRVKQLYTKLTIRHRNAIWQMDFFVPPIHLVPREGSDQIKRIVECAIVDGATRRLLAWAWQEGMAPSAELALATLAKALWTHGCPDLLITDNGAEFLSNKFTQVGAVHGFDIQPARPYAPYQKGRIERWFYTKEQQFLRKQPYYLKGPRNLADKLYGGTEGPLPVDEYVRRSEGWIDQYNNQPHSSL
jgi:transposase InsO family protein